MLTMPSKSDSWTFQSCSKAWSSTFTLICTGGYIWIQTHIDKELGIGFLNKGGTEDKNVTFSSSFSDKNSCHSERLSLASRFAQFDKSTSMMLSMLNARVLNLNCWSFLLSSFCFTRWFIQRLATSSIILCESWQNIVES